MRNNLRVNYTILSQVRKWLPGERITRLRNLALFISGLYLAGAVHLSHIARELPTPGKLPSLANRLRRFLNNPRVGVRDFYRPVARQLMSRFKGPCLRLIIDSTKLVTSQQNPLGEIKLWLVSRICGDTQVPGTCQVHDIRRFASI